MNGDAFDALTEEILSRPGATERIDAQVARMNWVLALEKLRVSRHLTQAEVAERMGVSQRRVSAIEHSDETGLKLDTLQRYVEGLGGQLEVVAVIEGERIPFTVT